MSESVYNLIPRVEEKPPKPIRHTSKFKTAAKQEKVDARTNYLGTNYKTMGPAKVDAPSTTGFMKKDASQGIRDTIRTHVKKNLDDPHCEITVDGQPSYHDGERKKPPVPRRDEQPVMGLRTQKDFIQQNAIENIMAVPRKAEKKFVDTRGGTTQFLEPSGLEPVFTKKKEFGKMPDYLVQRNRDVKQAQDEYNAFIKEHMRRGQMDQLSPPERQALIDGLKTNWEKIHKEYQSLSVMIDTLPKKMRKQRMEAEMALLEKDIEMLERHTVIYIAN